MQEVFYEESATLTNTGSAKTKYYIFKTFSIISYVLAVIWLMLTVPFFPTDGEVFINILFVAIPFVLFLASGILTGKFKDKFYVDYDYTFVTGSVRFSKVIKNVKRRQVLMFDTGNIEKIGRYGSEVFSRYSSMPNKKQLVLTSNDTPADGKALYYLFVGVGGEKYLIVIECSETFISHLIRYSSRTVIEDGFFSKKQ